MNNLHATIRPAIPHPVNRRYHGRPVEILFREFDQHGQEVRLWVVGTYASVAEAAAAVDAEWAAYYGADRSL